MKGRFVAKAWGARGTFSARTYPFGIAALCLALAACATPDNMSATGPASVGVITTLPAGYIHLQTKDGDGSFVSDTTYDTHAKHATDTSRPSPADSLAMGAMAAFVVGLGPDSLLSRSLAVRIGGHFMILEAPARDGAHRATRIRMHDRVGDSVVTITLPTSTHRSGHMEVVSHGALISATDFEVGAPQASQVAAADCGALWISIMAGLATGTNWLSSILAFLGQVSNLVEFANNCSTWLANALNDYYTMCAKWPVMCAAGV